VCGGAITRCRQGRRSPQSRGTYHSSPQSIAEANDLDENALTLVLPRETRLIIPIAPAPARRVTRPPTHTRLRATKSQGRYGGIGGKEFWRFRGHDPQMESPERQQPGGPKESTGARAGSRWSTRTEGWIEVAGPPCNTAQGFISFDVIGAGSAGARFVRPGLFRPRLGQRACYAAQRYFIARQSATLHSVFNCFVFHSTAERCTDHNRYDARRPHGVSGI